MANEKLIDANARIEEIKKAQCAGCENYGGVRCRACWVDDAIGLIDDAPTVDAVPVVRCKDCKNRGDEGKCPMYHIEEIEWDDDGYREVDLVPYDYTADDGFCSYGERREGE